MDCPSQPDLGQAIEWIVSTDPTQSSTEPISQLCFHSRLFGNEVADHPELAATNDPVQTFKTVGMVEADRERRSRYRRYTPN